MSDEPTNESLADIVRKAVNARLEQVRTMTPARVETFNPGDQTVDVQPLIRRVRVDGETRIEEKLPIITAVPVQFLRWGGFVFRCGIKPGDSVSLVMSDRELEIFLSAPVADLVTPQSRRMLSINDAVATPGFGVWADPIPGLADMELVIGREDGTGELRIGVDGAMRFGPAAAVFEPAIKGDTLVTSLQSLTVPTAFGPSGPPINAASFTAAKSATVKVG